MEYVTDEFSLHWAFMQAVAISVAALTAICAGITKFRREVKLHTFGSGLAAGNSFQNLNNPSVLDLTKRMGQHNIEWKSPLNRENTGEMKRRRSSRDIFSKKKIDSERGEWGERRSQGTENKHTSPSSSSLSGRMDTVRRSGILEVTTSIVQRALVSSEALLGENLQDALEGLSAEGIRRRTTAATNKAKSKLGQHVFRSRELSSQRSGISMTSLSEAVPKPLTDDMRAHLQAQDSRGLDFTGHWRADKKRSSSLDKHLEALGVPWIARAVATNSVYNARIEQKGLWWLESSTTAIVTTSFEMRLDGRPQSEPHPMDKSECHCVTTIEAVPTLISSSSSTSSSRPRSPKSVQHFNRVRDSAEESLRVEKSQERESSRSERSKPQQSDDEHRSQQVLPQPRRSDYQSRLQVVTRTTYLKHGHTQVVSRWLENDGATYVVANDLSLADGKTVLKAILYFDRVDDSK